MSRRAILAVLADVDDDVASPDVLKEKYWQAAEAAGISRGVFDKVLFLFPKYRIENWIQYINNGSTDENAKGPRVPNSVAKEAGKKLAQMCLNGTTGGAQLPLSLEWSCRNWHGLLGRMQ